MCGLVGIYDYSANGMYKRDADMFQVMLLLNSLRGAHSTGVLGVDKNSNMDYIKTTGGPEAFSLWAETDKFMNRIPARYHTVIGHGRFATKGDIDAETAHPFVREDVGMIHNGTMWNYEALSKELYPNLTFKSDSELCVQIIQDQGLEELVKRYTGGFAFITYNRKENAIQIVRNEDRPMFFFQPEFSHQWLFSSEDEVFAYISAKFHMKGKVLQANPNVIYTFKIGEDKYTSHEVKKYRPPVNHHWTNENIDYGGDGDMCGAFFQRAPRARMPNPPAAVSRKKNNVVDLSPTSSQFKLGEKVTFSMIDFSQRTLPDGVTLATWVDGELITTVPTDKKISVVGLYLGVPEEIYEEVVLTGEVQSIIALSESVPDYHTRLFVKNIMGFKAAVVEQRSEARIELADGSTITEWRWKELINDGCGVCQAKFDTPPNPKTCTIVPPKHGVMLGGPRLACPHCTANQVFDKGREQDHVQGQMH